MPPVGMHKKVIVILGGAGEGSFLVAKELTFQDSFGNSRAVDRHKMPFALTQPVNGRGDQLLARPGLPDDEHSGIGGGRTLDDVVDLTHWPTRANHPVPLIGLCSTELSVP